MKLLMFATMFLVACNPMFEKGEGTITGKLVDVEWGGVFRKSCEIVVQVGEQSSKMDQTSSTEKALCDAAATMLNKRVSVKYVSHAFQPKLFPATESSDLARSIEVVE